MWIGTDKYPGLEMAWGVMAVMNMNMNMNMNTHGEKK